MTPLVFIMPPMTLAEFKTLSWAHIQKVRKGLLIAPIFGLFIVATNLSIDAKFKAEDIGLLTGIIIILGIILLYGLMFLDLNKNIEKIYRNTPALSEGITVTLTDNSIRFHSQSVNSETPWPISYKKALNLKNWVVLSSGPASAYFLNTGKLQSPSTIADMQALFQRKGISLTR